jgi:hypothetical protein
MEKMLEICEMNVVQNSRILYKQKMFNKREIKMFNKHEIKMLYGFEPMTNKKCYIQKMRDYLKCCTDSNPGPIKKMLYKK